MSNKFKFRTWNNGRNSFSVKEIIQLSNETVQPSSGELDKNGKEIFAGDIVKFHNKSEYTKKEYWFPIYEITWDGFSFGLKYLGGGWQGDTAGFAFRHRPNEFEVIGNIFESTIIIPKKA